VATGLQAVFVSPIERLYMPELSTQELATILVALRLLQKILPDVSREIADLAASGAATECLNPATIDQLCQRVNLAGSRTTEERSHGAHVLYDMDARELLTTQVFASYAAAAEAAGELTDVVIVAIPVPAPVQDDAGEDDAGQDDEVPDNEDAEA
jgi:hypothetical protein